jgi:flagellin
MNVVNAGGSSQTGPISFTPIAADGGTQALTISANNSSGVMQSTTITLAATGSGTVGLGNDGSASSLGAAVNYINQQLQKTDNPTLQSVVAVEQNVNGTPEIGFMSSLNNFQVAIGTGGGQNSQAVGGLNGGTAETATAGITGQGGTISIDTQAGAEAAVTAVTNAVSKLGLAQAVVGKGENQLNYAVNLANSQITNVSVAESNIMDADVAMEAANLSKAQVLNQAAVAAMAQANSAPQVVLTLLRS